MENDKELNSKLLKEMFNAIRSAEIKNVKTQKKDDKGMIQSIEKYIFEKVGEEMKQNED